MDSTRYAWKRMGWGGIPQWRLLDTQTDRYVGDVFRYSGNHYTGAGESWASLDAAKRAVENKLESERAQ